MRNCEADSNTLWNSMTKGERSNVLEELEVVPENGQSIRSLSDDTFSELPDYVQEILIKANGGLGFSIRVQRAAVWAFARLKPCRRVVLE